MLQEQSCKKLSAALKRSFGQAQIVEFLSRIDIDINRQMKEDQNDINVKSRLQQQLFDGQPTNPQRAVPMLASPEENEFYDPMGQGESYMGPPNLQNAGNQSQSGLKTMKSLLKIPTTITPQTTQNSQQLANAVRFGTKKSIAPDKQQTFKTIPTGISEIKRLPTKQTPLTRLQTIQSLGQTRTLRSNRTMLQEAESIAPLKKEKPVQYVKVGDRILLTLKIQVFSHDIEQQQMKDTAASQGELYYEEMEKKIFSDKEKLINMRLSKIIDDPVFVYKGVLYCEGLNNMNIQVLPKRTPEDTQNAMSQFTKCTFFVEPAQNIDKLVATRQIEKEINTIKDTRQQFFELGDHMQVAKIDTKLQELEDQQKVLLKELEVEKLTNIHYINKTRGKQIQFGDPIQLRHEFTGMYLSITQTEMSNDHGAIKVQIGDLTANSFFNFIPCKNEHEFRSEMFLNVRDGKKFKFASTGQVNAREAFYLVNTQANSSKAGSDQWVKQNYYIHVDKHRIATTDGQNSILEVNASLNPTKLIAKIFDSINTEDQHMLKSGDVIRIMHVDTGCYMQADSVFNGNKNQFPSYPDFLQAEINQLRNQVEGWEGEFQNQENASQEDSFDLDQSDDQQKKQKEEEGENATVKNKTIYLETETRRQSFTDQLWEIQMENSFVGGVIGFEQKIRLKHIASDTFLALDSEGLYLNLKKDPVQQKTAVFVIKKPQDDVEKFDQTSQIYLQTSNETFVQVYQNNKDEVEKLFDYTDFSPHEFYNTLDKKSTLNLVAAKPQPKSDDQSLKMIFQLQKVEPELQKIAFECSSVLKQLDAFYKFLNTWAVIKDTNAEAVYDTIYDCDTAIHQEDILSVETIKITTVIQKVADKLKNLASQSQIKYQQFQIHLAEQKILECIIILIELIYYKTMPPDYRSKPFQPDRFLKFKVFDLSSENYLCFQIARDHLDPLNLLLLNTLYLMIKNNKPNCERATKFVDILFRQFRRQPNPNEQQTESIITAKLFCHIYKTADYIFNDRAAVIKSEEGINQHLPENFTNLHQVTRWLGLLETVQCQDTVNNNLKQQSRYLKIIAAFCRTPDPNKFKYIYQLQIIQRLFYFEENIPVWFGSQRRADKSMRPYLFFARLHQETVDQFLAINPIISSCYGQSLNQEGDRNFDIIFDISELTLRHEEAPAVLDLYFDYVSRVVQLYTALVGGRNREATTIVRERIGATEQVLLSLCQPMEKQQIQTIQNLKPSTLNLLTAIVLKWQPFNEWSVVKNRVFFWNKLDESEPYNLVYDWEKIKHGEDKTNTYGCGEEEIVNTALRIRQVIEDYIENGPIELAEFLYSSEKKTYTSELVNPKISSVSQYLDVAIDCLRAENCDTVYIQKILDLSVKLLLGVSSTAFIELFNDSWIYKLIRVVQKVQDSRQKLLKLVKKTLEILKLVSHHRLTQQVLVFLKQFKDFEETNYFSHIGFDAKQMDAMFKNIFTIQQFNVDIKSLQLMYLILNPKQKIILDAEAEQAVESARIKRQEERALLAKKKSMRSVQGSDFDSMGNIQDLTYQQTLRSMTSLSRLKSMNSDRSSFKRKKTQEEEEELSRLLAEDLNPSEEEKKAAMVNKDIPFDEYLLYFAFLRTENTEIPEDALEIITRSVRQRELLIEEACKVSLVVSENDFENYKMIRFLKDRLNQVITRLNQEEYTFLLYRLGQQDQIRQKIQDLINVFQQLAKIFYSCEDEVLRSKLQNFALQVDFIEVLFSKLLKQVYYDRQTHKKLFDHVMEFLFWFCKDNRDCQQALKPHLSYIAHLFDIDIKNSSVLAQVIQVDKLNGFGMKFHQFVVRKLIVAKNYKPQIFDYMRYIIQDEPTLQCYFLSQVVADSSFRFRIYMNTGTAKEKTEIIQEMVRKRLIFGKQDNAEVELAGDILKVNLHVSIVQFLSTCAEGNIYGVRQIRRLVELESLMDALLAQSIPYQIKKYYFRLFYVGFVQQIGDLDIIDIAFPRFLQMLRYIVLFDLEEFHKFFEGLVITHPVGMGEEAMNDPEFKRLKIRIIQELAQQTQETQDRLTARKTFKQMNEEKEMRNSLSPLNQSRPFPFLEENNFIEYWQYLCCVDKETGKPDGLLIFIADLYRVLIQKRLFWSEELKLITQKLYDVLMNVIDRLHQLKDTYQQNLIEIDDLQFALSDAILNIPMNSSSKGGDLNTTANSQVDEDQLDEDVKEKILRYTRDFIISKNLTIRQAFGINSLRQDINVHPYFIKHKLKEICGQDVGFKEIEMLVRKLMVLTKKKQQLAAVVGVQIGQPGHIRTRYSAYLHMLNTAKYRKPSQQSQRFTLENPEDQFNFRELEVLIKNALSKAGFKAPIIRRERITADLLKDDQGNVVKDENGKEIELDFEMKMEPDDLSKGTQIDYQHFIKCYWEFLQRYNNVDDINDLAKKILQKFNLIFIQGTKLRSSSIELKEYEPLKIFLRNVVRCVNFDSQQTDYLDVSKHQIMAYDYYKKPKTNLNLINRFLMELLTKMLTQLQIQNYEPEIQTAAIMRFTTLQRISAQQGLIQVSLNAINPIQQEQIVSQAFRLLNALIENNNTIIVEQFYDIVKDKSYMFLAVLRTRITHCVEQLLNKYVTLEPVFPKGRASALQAEKSFVKDPDLDSQPYYVPDGFNLGRKLQERQEHTELNELLLTLEFIRNLCNKGSQFQKLLQKQSGPYQVDLVRCVCQSLIKITQKLKQQVFTDFTAYTCLEQLFLTMEILSYGQDDIKLQFANYRNLQKTLNFYIEQNFVYFSADSALSRMKIKLMYYALRLISSCIETESNMTQVIQEVSLQSLKSQLIGIFKFRIGGTPEREHAFRTSKFCKHSEELCTKNEYCFFEDLVSFDLFTIECGFLMFQILMQANKLLPAQILGNIRFNKDTGNLFLQNKQKYFKQIQWESFERIQETLQEIQRQTFFTDEKEKSELNRLLEDIFINMNEHKIERRFFKAKEAEEKSSEKDLTTGIDKKQKLIEKDLKKIALQTGQNQNIYEKDEEEDYEFEERFLEIIGKAMKQPNPFKRLCCKKVPRNATPLQRQLRTIFCFSYLHKIRRSNTSFQRASDKIRQLIKDRKEAPDAKTKSKIDQYIMARQIEVQRKRTFLGPFTGSLTKQILESTSYVFDQFKYDFVYRFMLNQMSTVELLIDGKIVSELFPIPTYCNFFSIEDQQNIALELTQIFGSESKAKIDAFVSNMPRYKAKMIQNQKLARFSPALYEMTQLTPFVKRTIYAITFLVNLIICYAYTYKYEVPKIVYIYDPRDWLREAVNIDGFIAPVLRRPPTIDPWAIKLKEPFFSYPIDYLPLINAAFAIFNFVLELCTFDAYQDENSQGKGVIVEEKFTTASLASQLPSKYLKHEEVTRLKGLTDYLYSLVINSHQQKNFIIVLLTIAGMLYATYLYPITLLYLVFRELEIVKSFIKVLYKRAGQLIALVCIDILVFYILGYISFLRKNCLEVTECIVDQIELLLELQNAPPLEIAVFFIFGLLTFNLFFGLIVDSISEIRQSKQAIQELISQKCFICDLTKQDFEIIKEDFEKHLKEQHNVMAYVYYLLWLSDSQYPSGNISRFVKAKVQKGQIDFIPYRNCKLMQKE